MVYSTYHNFTVGNDSMLGSKKLKCMELLHFHKHDIDNQT